MKYVNLSLLVPDEEADRLNGIMRRALGAGVGAFPYTTESVYYFGIDDASPGRKQWQSGGPENHRFDAFPNDNLGGHVFRHPSEENSQRRCARCGYWETTDSRDKPCDPKVWNGGPA